MLRCIMYASLRNYQWRCVLTCVWKCECVVRLVVTHHFVITILNHWYHLASSTSKCICSVNDIHLRRCYRHGMSSAFGCVSEFVCVSMLREEIGLSYQEQSRRDTSLVSGRSEVKRRDIIRTGEMWVCRSIPLHIVLVVAFVCVLWSVILA